MKRRTRKGYRSLPSPNVHRLAEGAELVLADANTVLLVVRGACAVRGAASQPEKLEAGALVLQKAAASPALDRRAARALAMLQAEPAKPWTVERLARAVGLSRAAFARRFVALSGRSPARFLSELRLALAASLLDSTDLALAEVAASVGYTSEFAFSRAFKRRHGVAPGAFRRFSKSARFTPLGLAA